MAFHCAFVPLCELFTQALYAQLEPATHDMIFIIGVLGGALSRHKTGSL
jgi:hypothetical protein